MYVEPCAREHVCKIHVAQDTAGVYTKAVRCSVSVQNPHLPGYLCRITVCSSVKVAARVEHLPQSLTGEEAAALRNLPLL